MSNSGEKIPFPKELLQEFFALEYIWKVQKALLEKYTNLQAAFIVLDANKDHFIYANELSEKLLEKEICNEADKHGTFFNFMDRDQDGRISWSDWNFGFRVLKQKIDEVKAKLASISNASNLNQQLETPNRLKVGTEEGKFGDVPVSDNKSVNKRMLEINKNMGVPAMKTQYQSSHSSGKIDKLPQSQAPVGNILEKYQPKLVYKENDVRKKPIELPPDYDDSVAFLVKMQQQEPKYESIQTTSTSHRSYENRVTFGGDVQYQSTFRSRADEQSDVHDSVWPPNEIGWKGVENPRVNRNLSAHFANENKNFAYVETLSREPTQRSEQNADAKALQSPGPKIPKDIPLSPQKWITSQSEAKNSQATQPNPITKSTEINKLLAPITKDTISPIIAKKNVSEDPEKFIVEEGFEIQNTPAIESTSGAQFLSPDSNRTGEKAKSSGFGEMASETPAESELTVYERPARSKPGQNRYRTDQSTPNSGISSSSKGANQNEGSTINTEELQTLTMKPERKQRSDIVLENTNRVPDTVETFRVRSPKEKLHQAGNPEREMVQSEQEVIQSPPLGKETLSPELNKQSVLPREHLLAKQNFTDEPKARVLDESRRTSNLSTNLKEPEDASSDHQKDNIKSQQNLDNLCSVIENESSDPIKNFASLYNELGSKINLPVELLRSDNPTLPTKSIKTENLEEKTQVLNPSDSKSKKIESRKVPRIPLKKEDSPINQQDSSSINDPQVRGRNKAVPYEPLANFKVDMFKRRDSSGPKPKDESIERVEQPKSKEFDLLKAQRTNFSSTEKEPRDATPLSNHSDTSRDSSREPGNRSKRSIDPSKFLKEARSRSGFAPEIGKRQQKLLDTSYDSRGSRRSLILEQESTAVGRLLEKISPERRQTLSLKDNSKTSNTVAYGNSPKLAGGTDNNSIEDFYNFINNLNTFKLSTGDVELINKDPFQLETINSISTEDYFSPGRKTGTSGRPDSPSLQQDSKYKGFSAESRVYLLNEFTRLNVVSKDLDKCSTELKSDFSDAWLPSSQNITPFKRVTRKSNPST